MQSIAATVKLEIGSKLLNESLSLNVVAVVPSSFRGEGWPCTAKPFELEFERRRTTPAVHPVASQVCHCHGHQMLWGS